MSQQRIVVAIDGPAGAGKSTDRESGRGEAGLHLYRTGAMYRAVALWALRAGIPETDVHKLEQLALRLEIAFCRRSQSVFLNGEDVTEAIRLPEVSAAASKVSAIAAYGGPWSKAAGDGPSGSVVMEGRDIGSVVFPEAE